MSITDMNGMNIEITDLDKAMAQAERFTTFCHEDSFYKQMDERLNEYWKHILEQLTTLKKRIVDDGNRIF